MVLNLEQVAHMEQFLSFFLAQKIANKPLTIVGSGNQTRDFLHVSDLTNLILKSAYSKIRGKIYNVAGGKEIKVNKIAKLIGGKKVFYPKTSR